MLPLLWDVVFCCCVDTTLLPLVIELSRPDLFEFTTDGVCYYPIIIGGAILEVETVTTPLGLL